LRGGAKPPAPQDVGPVMGVEVIGGRQIHGRENSSCFELVNITSY
jgi:hypothetical protein